MTLYLTVQQVFDIHQKLEIFISCVDLDLLSSAVMMAQWDVLHPTIFDKAAAYLFHISRNHAFTDGNKRTAAIATLVFLEINGYELTCEDNEYEDIVVYAAEGMITKAEISLFLSKSTSNKNSS